MDLAVAGSTTLLRVSQELRSRVGASSTQAGEMLLEAQAICDEAESRAEAAEKCAPVQRLPLAFT